MRVWGLFLRSLFGGAHWECTSLKVEAKQNTNYLMAISGTGILNNYQMRSHVEASNLLLLLKLAE